MAKDVNEEKHFFDDPKNVRRVMRTFFAACAVVFSLDIVDLILRWAGGPELRHAEAAWEGFPGFYGFFGFFGVALLVLAAKQLRKGLMRDEDYYDR